MVRISEIFLSSIDEFDDNNVLEIENESNVPGSRFFSLLPSLLKNSIPVLLVLVSSPWSTVAIVCLVVSDPTAIETVETRVINFKLDLHLQHATAIATTNKKLINNPWRWQWNWRDLCRCPWLRCCPCWCFWFRPPLVFLLVGISVLCDLQLQRKYGTQLWCVWTKEILPKIRRGHYRHRFVQRMEASRSKSAYGHCRQDHK